jgi:hypothetical protein
MKQYVKSSFFLFVFGLICSEVQARDCVVHPYKATWGQEMPANMIMAKNTTCQTVVKSSGQESVVIETPPKNGVATAIPDGAKYKPNKDFVGNDEFVYLRKGTDKWGKTQESRVRVKVEIQKDKL